MPHALPDLDHRRRLLRTLGTRLDTAGVAHRVEERSGTPVLSLREFDHLAGRVWTFPTRRGGWVYRWDREDKFTRRFGADQAELLAERIGSERGWARADLDFSTPNVARMYDYYLGGKDNYPPDREAAEQVLESAPEVRSLARENRAFIGRAVRHLAGECGVRQFLDVGSGLPTRSNTHEIAQRARPDARVAYVDNDPVVTSHAQALLATGGQTTAVEADLRWPHEVTDHLDLRALIDFDEPIVVVMTLLLHFLSDEDDPAGVVAAVRDRLAPGSYLVLSHGTLERQPEEVGVAAKVYERASSRATLRSREQITDLFRGFELPDPGVVYLPEWDPGGGGADRGAAAWGVLAGVARLP